MEKLNILVNWFGCHNNAYCLGAHHYFKSYQISFVYHCSLPCSPVLSANFTLGWLMTADHPTSHCGGPATSGHTCHDTDIVEMDKKAMFI